MNQMDHMRQPDQYNPKNMTAKDMFSDNLIQVFSKKKGTWLGTVSEGYEFNFTEPEEIPQETEIININQLTLF